MIQTSPKMKCPPPHLLVLTALPIRPPLSFSREYMGLPPLPAERVAKLRELAMTYHRRTEDYDRSVCSGPILNGSIMPGSAAEASRIEKHAMGVRDELWVSAAAHGFSRGEWLDAIQAAAGEPTHDSDTGAPLGPDNDLVEVRCWYCDAGCIECDHTGYLWTDRKTAGLPPVQSADEPPK